MKLTFNVNQQIETVFDHLTDMQKFVVVHPVITKIVNTTGNKFIVHETLRFGFIPLSFTYSVAVDQNPGDKAVTFHARVMKLTKIKMSFNLKQENNRTVVNETIDFQSPFPVRTIMENIFRKQHTLLFKNMDGLKKSVVP